MTHDFLLPFLASLLAASVTAAGIGAIQLFARWGERNATYFSCFAAGVLVSVSLVHIIPTSFGMTPLAPVFLLLGYLVFYASDRLITTQVCQHGRDIHYALGLVPMLGIGLHSFVDGVVYSVAFSVSAFTGGLAAIGMVLHEFPEGIVTYILLLRAGFSARLSLLLSFIAAAVTTPAGMLISWPFVSIIDNRELGALLAVAAGALLYVGATHLLPQAEREPRRYNFLAVMLGVLLAVAIMLSEGA